MVYFRENPGLNAPINETAQEGAIIREISYLDRKKPFMTGEPLMDRFNLEDYFKWSLSENSIVLVIESGCNIAAACHLIASDRSVMINMLARNSFSKMHGAGTMLLNFVEVFAAEVLGIHKITLESLDRESLIKYYQKHGFVMHKLPVEDRKWGKLYPMVKRIASGVN